MLINILCFTATGFLYFLCTEHMKMRKRRNLLNELISVGVLAMLCFLSETIGNDSVFLNLTGTFSIQTWVFTVLAGLVCFTFIVKYLFRQFKGEQK